MPRMKVDYNTVLHKQLINILNKNKVVNYSSIIEFLNKIDLKFNKSSIYRQLKSMEDLGRIYSFNLNSTQHWELSMRGSHAHFICSECSVITCLNQLNIELEGYQINEISFKGLCNKCLI